MLGSLLAYMHVVVTLTLPFTISHQLRLSAVIDSSGTLLPLGRDISYLQFFTVSPRYHSQ